MSTWNAQSTKSDSHPLQYRAAFDVSTFLISDILSSHRPSSSSSPSSSVTQSTRHCIITEEGSQPEVGSKPDVEINQCFSNMISRAGNNNGDNHGKPNENYYDSAGKKTNNHARSSLLRKSKDLGKFKESSVGLEDGHEIAGEDPDGRGNELGEVENRLEGVGCGGGDAVKNERVGNSAETGCYSTDAEKDASSKICSSISLVPLTTSSPQLHRVGQRSTRLIGAESTSWRTSSDTTSGEIKEQHNHEPKVSSDKVGSLNMKIKMIRSRVFPSAISLVNARHCRHDDVKHVTSGDDTTSQHDGSESCQSTTDLSVISDDSDDGDDDHDGRRSDERLRILDGDERASMPCSSIMAPTDCVTMGREVSSGLRDDCDTSNWSAGQKNVTTARSKTVTSLRLNKTTTSSSRDHDTKSFSPNQLMTTDEQNVTPLSLTHVTSSTANSVNACPAGIRRFTPNRLGADWLRRITDLNPSPAELGGQIYRGVPLAAAPLCCPGIQDYLASPFFNFRFDGSGFNCNDRVGGGNNGGGGLNGMARHGLGVAADLAAAYQDALRHGVSVRHDSRQISDSEAILRNLAFNGCPPPMPPASSLSSSSSPSSNRLPFAHVSRHSSTDFSSHLVTQGGPGSRLVTCGDNFHLRLKCRRNRTVYSEHHLTCLESNFERQKYLTTKDRILLANQLGLTQIQVKTWYQNRRMKWKKQVLQEGGTQVPTKSKGRPKKQDEEKMTLQISAAS